MRIKHITQISMMMILLTGCNLSPSEQGYIGFLQGMWNTKLAIDAAAGEDGTDKAEGYRYALRLIEMNLGRIMPDHDPAHPTIDRCPTKICKLGFDSPDYSYLELGPLSHEYTYRVYGKRGTIPLMLFQIFNVNSFGGGATMDSTALTISEDGTWEIILSAIEPNTGNWLPLDENSDRLVIRNVFNDWLGETEAGVQIEVLDEVSESVPVLTPEDFKIGGGTVGIMISRVIPAFLNNIQALPLNDLVTPCTTNALGGCEGDDAGFGNYASAGRYQLADNEVMIIELDNENVLFHNIQLANMWGESLDYASKQTSLNGSQAQTDSDGKIRYVLAPTDPGVANWLDTSGHSRGGLFLRWIDPNNPALEPSKPEITIVPFEELSDHLPVDTSYISADARRSILKNRLKGYNRRKNPANL